MTTAKQGQRHNDVNDQGISRSRNTAAKSVTITIGTSKKRGVRRVTWQGIPGAARMDSEEGPWVNSLPDVETREGEEHAAKALPT